MRTPMQELLKEVINAREIAMGIDFRSALDFVRDAIEQDYLEKEKEAIMDAFSSGEHQQGFEGEAEQYYNETFNTNQENLQDSTNGYTYYPQEYKTVFNTKEK